MFKVMSQTEAAYFAGILDGEGTITVVVSELKRSPTLRPRIMISSTDRRLLEWIVQFGGKIYNSRRKAIEGQRFIWTWAAERQDEIINILQQTHSFLLLKQEQSALLQEFCASRLMKMKIRRGVPGYSQREVDIHERMRVLNKRGTKKSKVKCSEAVFKVNDLLNEVLSCRK